MSSSEPTLSELKGKLAEEDRLYSDILAELDALSQIRAPYDRDELLAPLLENLNRSAAALSDASPPTSGVGGVKGIARRFVRRFVEPDLTALRSAIEKQREFDSHLVQFLNRFAETVNAVAASHAEFVSALMRFAQRIDRLADAKDRLYATLGNTRCDLLLEAMDKRLETVRLGLRQMTDRVGGMDTALTLARAELRGLAGRLDDGAGDTGAPPDPHPQSFEAEHYLAFEERFRGDSDELRARLRDYVPLFEGREPVVDLGCGRGEFLELLKEAGIASRGIDGNREMVHACRDKELEAEVGDILAYVAAAKSAAHGGVFAAQVIEHLPPATLRKFLGDCYRILRSEGRIVLETVNPQSVAAFVAFYRDLTHQKPLHPETLEFLLRAVGFRDVTIRTSSPVSERARLMRVTEPGETNDTLNRNFEKLNAFLFGDQDYAVIGTK